jgi:hypothetical protein
MIPVKLSILQKSEFQKFEKFSTAFYILLFTILILSPLNAIFSDKKDNKFVYGFFDEEGTRYIKMIVVGETLL